LRGTAVLLRALAFAISLRDSGFERVLLID
jgi:hypothetical protein